MDGISDTPLCVFRKLEMIFITNFLLCPLLYLNVESFLSLAYFGGWAFSFSDF